MSNTSNRRDLSRMGNQEILAAVRAMEASYKSKVRPIEHDHRRHLTRDELETVYSLTCRVLQIRQIDPESVLRPFGIHEQVGGTVASTSH